MLLDRAGPATTPAPPPDRIRDTVGTGTVFGRLAVGSGNGTAALTAAAGGW
jgi:hypothetical protein